MAIFTAVALAAVLASGVNVFSDSISHTLVYVLVSVSVGGMLLYFFVSSFLHHRGHPR
jgi:hypothetical protein